jgi:hypothetical protein
VAPAANGTPCRAEQLENQSDNERGPEDWYRQNEANQQ